MRVSLRARVALGCAIACFFVAPTVASAVVSVSGGVDGGGDYVVDVQGDSGTQNLTTTSTATSVTFAAGGGESMTAGSGCSGTGPVTCTFDPQTDFVDVLLAGGNDVFTAQNASNDLGLFVDGGDGADVIRGTSFSDYLMGGIGDDKLTGGPGVDFYDGGDDNDVLDLVDGGQDDASSSCGSGSLDLVLLDPSESVAAGCEYVAPRFTSAPVISGNAAAGSPLTVSNGTIFGGPGVVFAQSWLSCSEPTKGCVIVGSGQTYTPSQKDVGRYLVAIVDAVLDPFGYLVGSTSGFVRVAPASNVFSVGSFKTGATGSLSITVPGPGTLTAGPVTSGSAAKKKKKKVKVLVSKSSKTVSAAGAVNLPIKLTSEGKKQLRKKSKLKVKVTIKFTPTGGVMAAKTTTVTFKVKKKK